MMRRVRRGGVFVLVVVTALAACGTATPGAGSEARVAVAQAPAGLLEARQAAGAVNAFGLALLDRDLGTADGNVALSPWSIATALAMVRAGAEGATATEIDEVLHIADPAGIDQEMDGLGLQLASRTGSFPGANGPLTVDFSAGNRVYVQQGLVLQPPFRTTLARDYGAGVGLVDFKTATESARRQINAWVADQTHNRIAQLLAPGTLDALSRLVLVNAVYLQADWQTPFAKDQTADGIFDAPGGDVSVPFMHDTDLRTYASGDGWQAVGLTYAGGQLAMTILVPDPGRYDDVVTHLSASVLAAVDDAQEAEVDLALPKFEVDHAVSLKQQLSALGMPTAFTDQADFSGITTQERLKLQDVIHEADITVDEKGTVAAAATAAIIEGAAAAIRVEQLVVDRPFVFLLRDVPTGALLFAGQVTNPSGAA
jgi:serpin B